MNTNNVLLFLYPQEYIFEFEIAKNSRRYKDPKEDEKEEHFRSHLASSKSVEEIESIIKDAKKDMVYYYRKYYSEKLNECIDSRYRQKGYQIVYALLDDQKVSDIININKTDKIIYVGIDSNTHKSKDLKGNHYYPDPDYIINQIGEIKHLRVAGFHFGDCVNRIAKRAYQRGINTLVDEDLTELFSGRITDFTMGFQIDQFPPNSSDFYNSDFLIEQRVNHPWLWLGSE